MDPDNDLVVGPPDPVPDCEARLTAAGVRYRPARLLPERTARGLVCGNGQVVTYVAGPGGVRVQPSPIVSCGVALALARLTEVAAEEARAELGVELASITQTGTYACRKMVRYDWVSEHSYANAIDLEGFTLATGRKITVQRHFGRTNQPPSTPEARFLRTVARRLYDEEVFSVVLTPFFDVLHRNHFHLDLGRYRSDGTD
jgi:hypothetical protein